MATGLKSRVIFRLHSDTNTTLAGTYKLLVRATKIPSPIKEPNTVESSTLEDMVQTFELGRGQSGLLKVEGNYERADIVAINAMAGKQVDIIQLYGTDGLGGIGKYSYVAQVSAVPGDVDGDGIISMSVSIIPNTVPKDVFETFTVTSTGEDTAALSFTVAPKA